MKPRRASRQLRLRTVLCYAVLLAWTFFTLFPLLWLGQISFKNEADAFSYPPKWLFMPTLENYKVVLADSGYITNLVNSLVISLGSVSLSLLVGVPGAYSLSRKQFRGRRALFVSILAVRLAPGMTFAIPYFIALRQLGLIDTHLGLILVYFVFNLAMVIWSIISFFEDIPRALEEAAFIDGATQSQVFTKIVLPLAAPGLAATAILAFILSWNEFMFALLFTRRFAKTAPVAIMNFAAYEGISWGQMAAGAILLTVPVVMFAFLVRRYLVAGLVGGAVKG